MARRDVLRGGPLHVTWVRRRARPATRAVYPHEFICMPKHAGKHLPKHRKSRVVDRRHPRAPQGAAQHGDALVGGRGGDRRCRRRPGSPRPRPRWARAAKRVSEHRAPTADARAEALGAPRPRVSRSDRRDDADRRGAKPRDDEPRRADARGRPQRRRPARHRDGAARRSSASPPTSSAASTPSTSARAAGESTPTTPLLGATASRRPCPAPRCASAGADWATNPAPRSAGASATSRTATARRAAPGSFKQANGWY